MLIIGAFHLQPARATAAPGGDTGGLPTSVLHLPVPPAASGPDPAEALLSVYGVKKGMVSDVMYMVSFF